MNALVPSLGAAILLLAACVPAGAGPGPSASEPTALPSAPEPAPIPSATSSPTPRPSTLLVAVAAFTSPRDEVRLAELREVVVAEPFAEAVRSLIPHVRVVTMPEAGVLAAVRASPTAIGLVLPERVDPSVKTVVVDGMDFWSPALDRSTYPLVVPVDVAPGPVARTWELLAAGGIIYGRGVQERVELYRDPARPFAKVRDLTRAADLAVATLEAPLSGDANRFCEHCMTFVGNERYVTGIADAGFDALSLAANHSGDAGPQSVLDSVRVLREAGIVPFGGGPDAASARRPAILDVRGVRVALLGYSDVPPESYAATATRPGDAHLFHDDHTYASIRAEVAAARAVADVVVVLAHWGVEYEDRPRPWVEAAAHAMVEAGATAVLGDHPHWVQSVETYRGGYIAYSMGNFVFDQMWSAETRQGSIHRLFFSGSRLVAVRIVPTLLEDYHQPRPLLLGEPGYAQTLARIFRHSKFEGPERPAVR